MRNHLISASLSFFIYKRTEMVQVRGQQSFNVKGQKANTLGFMGYLDSVTTGDPWTTSRGFEIPFLREDFFFSIDLDQIHVVQRSPLQLHSWKSVYESAKVVKCRFSTSGRSMPLHRWWVCLTHQLYSVMTL